MPISVEPKVKFSDKERLQYHIKEIRKLNDEEELINVG